VVQIKGRKGYLTNHFRCCKNSVYKPRPDLEGGGVGRRGDRQKNKRGISCESLTVFPEKFAGGGGEVKLGVERKKRRFPYQD